MCPEEHTQRQKVHRVFVLTLVTESPLQWLGFDLTVLFDWLVCTELMPPQEKEEGEKKEVEEEESKGRRKKTLLN